MNVQSNWKVSENKSISDAVLSSESDSADLEDEIMVENCVMLEAPEKSAYLPACQLLFSCDPPDQICRLSVLCEARVIEVYGHHGEYLKTVKCVLIEEADDMIVFRADIVLDFPVSLCSIKFVMLRSQGEMWLYGVKVHTVKAAFDPQNQTAVPLAAVEERLSQMGLTLSDKAEAFKQLVQNCQKSNPLEQGLGGIMSSLLMSNLIKSKSPSPDNSSQMKDLSQVLNRDSLNNVKEESQKVQVSSVSTSPVVCESTTSSTQTEEYTSLEDALKTFVSEKCEDLDKKLWDKVDKRFKELEAKLLCKLDEIESFVKPQGAVQSTV